ncbi:MAG: twin-arginine translocase TatA/TatE family subunit [Denitrobacterium sp.]|nr:twin-arginine translocase TatA/TatE family subunit [Denitrobacterium sp.]
MFGIGANELALILLFGFLIFGPDKLPAIAKTIGRAIAKFRSAQNEMNDVIKHEVYDPDADEPFKNPLDSLNKIENDAKREDKGESFTERKARYDKQRAARKAAEARKAEREAEKRAAETGAAATAATAVAPKAESKPAVAAAPDIDELYGAVPHAKKAAPKPAATVAAAAPKPAPAPKKAQSADDLFEDDAEKEE